MKLSQDKINSALAGLSDWQQDGDCIKRSFKFHNFQQAMAFMVAAALHAEKHDHHPDWTNCYNRVDVSLTTHDAGGLTAKDFALADCMQKIGNCLLNCAH